MKRLLLALACAALTTLHAETPAKSATKPAPAAPAPAPVVESKPEPPPAPVVDTKEIEQKLDGLATKLDANDRLNNKIDGLATKLDTTDKVAAKLDKLEKDFKDRRTFWQANLPDGELRTQLTTHAAEPVDSFYKTVSEEYLPAIRAHDAAKANEIAFGKLQAMFQDHQEHIDKIVATYQFRNEEAHFSRRVGMEEIAANGYNLNISRYISTAKPEDAIDLAAVHAQLTALEKQIKNATGKHNEFLKELGLPPLP